MRVLTPRLTRPAATGKVTGAGKAGRSTGGAGEGAILGWVPIVGLVLAAFGVLLNRRRSIWRRLSWIGFGLSMALTGLFVVALALGW
jgi:hypothetical protein